MAAEATADDAAYATFELSGGVIAQFNSSWCTRVRRDDLLTVPRPEFLATPEEQQALARIDGGGVDVWVGSLPERRVTAVVCTVDTIKRDTELKLLLGCTPEEADVVLRTHNSDLQAAMLIPRSE